MFDRIVTGYRSRSADPEDAPAVAERALFYARCSVLEDIAYGVVHDREQYRIRGVAALDRLFGTV